MTGERTRRKELHDFLQAARARLKPKDLGLTPAPNRRGSGLQQADLATALNVSHRWYNGFENGTAGADDCMLDRISRLLRLTPAERVHLYLLATEHEPTPDTVEPPHGAEAVLARLVRQIGHPAVVTDIAWNVLAANRAHSTWFPTPAERPAETRNAVLWAFTREIESIVKDVGSFREAHVGWVHLALAGHPDDPRLAHLVDRLQHIPAAQHLWDTQQIARFTNSITPVRLLHPGSGTVSLADLVSTEFPGGYRLMMLVPRDSPPARPPGIGRLIRRK